MFRVYNGMNMTMYHEGSLIMGIGKSAWKFVSSNGISCNQDNGILMKGFKFNGEVNVFEGDDVEIFNHISIVQSSNPFIKSVTGKVCFDEEFGSFYIDVKDGWDIVYFHEDLEFEVTGHKYRT